MSQVLSFLQTIGILILVLVIFNFIIIVHEWGHFLAGRWRGLKIEKFQIWFGKPIWKKTYNGVQYGLGCIPLGR
jgi:regulator of sigma E protease